MFRKRLVLVLIFMLTFMQLPAQVNAENIVRTGTEETDKPESGNKPGNEENPESEEVPETEEEKPEEEVPEEGEEISPEEGELTPEGEELLPEEGNPEDGELTPEGGEISPEEGEPEDGELMPEGEELVPPDTTFPEDSDKPDIGDEEPFEESELDESEEDTVKEESESFVSVVIVAVITTIVVMLGIGVIILFSRKALSKKEKKTVTDYGTTVMPVTKETNYSAGQVGRKIYLENGIGKYRTKASALILGQPLVIGSDTNADIIFDDCNVEPFHAKIEEINGEVYLVDVSEEAGTYLEGMRIQQKNIICSGDIISVGNAEFRISF